MGYSAFSGLNSGNAGIKKTVRQVNSFSVGDVVRLDGSSYVLAKADSATNAEVIGVIESCNTNSFIVVFAGEINFGSSVATGNGVTWFLSPTEAGKVVNTAPTNTGTITKTVYIGIDGDRAIVVNYLGLINGFEGGGNKVSLDGVSPVGQIIPYAGPITTTAEIPSGWLLCDGGQFSRAEYPLLADVLGDTYGARAGSLYRLPDLRGRSPIGVNESSTAMEADDSLSLRVIGSQAGLEEVAMSVSEMPSHNHTATYLCYRDEKGDDASICETVTPNTYWGPAANTGQIANPSPTTGNPTGCEGTSTYDYFRADGPVLSNDWHAWSFGNDDHDYGKVNRAVSVESAGGGQAHNNMQPYTVTNWLIRADNTMAAKILTVDIQGMNDVNITSSQQAQSGSVLRWNAANDGVTAGNAKAGDDKFIIQPISDDRNVIINGNFDLWQRGTNFAGSWQGPNSNGRYCADRWLYQQSDSLGSAVTIQRSDSSNPFLTTSNTLGAHVSNIPSTYTMYNSVDNAVTDIGADDYSMFGYYLEGPDFARLWSDEYMTLSFWTSQETAGTYCVSFRNHNLQKSYVAEYTITTPNQWNYVTLTVPIPTHDRGSFLYGKGQLGLRINWVIASGTNHHGTANSWESANILATESQSNGLSTASVRGMWLSQVQLEPGRIATPFAVKNFQRELTDSQRYFCKSYNLEVPPKTVTQKGRCTEDDWVISRTAHFNAQFPQRMMRMPEVTIYNPNTGSTNQYQMIHRQAGSNTNHHVASVGRSETNIHQITRTSASTIVTGYKNKIGFHYTADAELYS